MKVICSNTLLLISLFCGSISAVAQKIHITDIKNTWVTNGYAAECTFTGIASYRADTVISGQHYLPLSYNTTSLGMGCTFTMGSLGQGYFIREDSAANMVYFRAPIMDTLEHVLYNYNLQIGDTIQYHYSGPTMTITDSVVAVDSVLINGIYHKTFDFAGKGMLWGRTYTIIEGVGGTNNPIFPAFFAVCFEYGEYLQCYRQGTLAPTFNMRRSLCVYNSGPLYANCAPSQVLNADNSPLSTTITPNPASTELQINATKNMTDVTIYNLTGRCVYHLPVSSQITTINTSTWRNGPYIVVVKDNAGNSKKELVQIVQ